MGVREGVWCRAGPPLPRAFRFTAPTQMRRPRPNDPCPVLVGWFCPGVNGGIDHGLLVTSQVWKRTGDRPTSFQRVFQVGPNPLKRPFLKHAPLAPKESRRNAAPGSETSQSQAFSTSQTYKGLRVKSSAQGRAVAAGRLGPPTAVKPFVLDRVPVVALPPVLFKAEVTQQQPSAGGTWDQAPDVGRQHHASEAHRTFPRSF